MTEAGSWSVKLASAAVRDLDKLPPRIVPAVLEFLFGPLADKPLLVGEPLRDDFAGEWSARRGSYRVLYRPDQESRQLIVRRVSHRADAYQPR